MYYARTHEGHTITVDSDAEAKIVKVHIDKPNAQGEDDEVLALTLDPQEALDLTRALHIELGLPVIPMGASRLL